MKRLVGLLLCLSLSSPAATIFGTVIGVSYGDTITVIDAEKVRHKIRLAGIDASEKAQPFGHASKQSLSDLVFGQSVTVDSGRSDRYGREIGKVFVDGADANLEQIKRGLAWHYKAYQREQSTYERLTYSTSEQNAATKRLGLWQDESPVAPWVWRHPAKEAPDNKQKRK